MAQTSSAYLPLQEIPKDSFSSSSTSSSSSSSSSHASSSAATENGIEDSSEFRTWPRGKEEWKEHLKTPMTWLKILIVLMVIGLTMTESTIFHNSFCNAVFRCGCTYEWAGGWNNCNVHNASGPHCPWCLARKNSAWTTGPLLQVLMLLCLFLLVWRWPYIMFRFQHRFNCCRSVLSQLLTYFLLLWLLPTFVYIIVGILVAWCFKLSHNYPFFLGWTSSSYSPSSSSSSFSSSSSYDSL